MMIIRHVKHDGEVTNLLERGLELNREGVLGWSFHVLTGFEFFGSLLIMIIDCWIVRSLTADFVHVLKDGEVHSSTPFEQVRCT